MKKYFDFSLQNYNEFHTWIRWHDYLSLIINEFPVILIRRYDWLDDGKITYMAQVLGLKIFLKVYDMDEDVES